jgi:hypothetical protein
MGQRIFECVLSIGTRSAQSITASGFTAAQTGRTHDRTRSMVQQLRKFLPSRRRPHMTLSRHRPTHVSIIRVHSAIRPADRLNLPFIELCTEAMREALASARLSSLQFQGEGLRGR